MSKERRHPAHKTVQFDRPTLELIHTALKENHIGFVPMEPCKTLRVSQFQKSLKIQPVQVDTLRYVVLNIRRPEQYKSRPRMKRLTYIGNDDMLHWVETETGDLDTFARTTGLKLSLYDKDQLWQTKLCNKRKFSKLSDAGKLNARIRMPDTINGTAIDPVTLTESIHDLYTVDIDTDDSIRWENPDARHRKICNNIRACGLTVMEYIQARYAYKLMSEFYVNWPFTVHNECPEIYRQLQETFTATDYDNWQNERLENPKVSCIETPDPEAYDILTKINKPTFEREPENKNTKTFDRIRIFLGLKSKASLPSRNSLITKHKKELVKIALLKIQSFKQFQNYGIPIQYIRPVQMTITNCDELEILFELKTNREV